MNHRVEKLLKVGPLLALFIFIIIYAFFGAKNLIFGIKIKNVSLANGATFQESILKVAGRAEGAVNLTLNGREISIDQEGNFEESIALLPGYNIVNINALDKFGYRDEKNYQLILARP